MAAFGGGGLEPFDLTRPPSSRRADERLPLADRPGRLEEAAGHGWRTLNGELVDVSAGGVGLLMNEPVRERTRVRIVVDHLSFATAAERRLASALAGGGAVGRTTRDGFVAYSLPDPARSGRWRTGISFAPMPPNKTGLISTRALCAVVLIPLWAQALLGSRLMSSVLGTLLISVVLLSLLAIAELDFRREQRRYEDRQRQWHSAEITEAPAGA